MLIIIFLYKIIGTNSFLLPETFNLMIKKNADYKVDMVINEEDYEMIDKRELNEFTVDPLKFAELDIMARKDFKNRSSTAPTSTDVIFYEEASFTLAPTSAWHRSTVNVSTIKSVETTKTGLHTMHTNKKREIVNETEMEYEYIYNDLLHEYNEQGSNETLLEASEIQDYGVMDSFKRIFLPQNQNDNCNSSIGLQAIQCLLGDYRSKRRPTEEVVARALSIAQIWFLVYLVVAIPLWCTRGWCCCCLFCKFFKPRQTIEEAKRYLVLNPPGVFHTKNGPVLYDPTEREKETYEEFEHFIKTL